MDYFIASISWSFIGLGAGALSVATALDIIGHPQRKRSHRRDQDS